MKRILVLSDTHHNISNIEKTALIAGPFDNAVHLGDCAEDARAVEEILHIACASVRGNCDNDHSVPEEIILEFEGVRILCLHGHRVHENYLLQLKAEQAHCKAVLFGHTHTPVMETAGQICIINPGSLARPRYGSAAGFCVLYIENGKMFVKHFTLD